MKLLSLVFLFLFFTSNVHAEKTPSDDRSLPERRESICSLALSGMKSVISKTFGSKKPATGTPEYRKAIRAKFDESKWNYEKLVLYGYVTQLQDFEWSWDESKGRAKVSISGVPEFAGQQLHMISQLVGYIFEGLLYFEGQPEYSMEYTPLLSETRPTYHLEVNLRPILELEELSQKKAGFVFNGPRVEFAPSHMDLKIEATIMESTMEATQAAVGHPSRYLFNEALDLYKQTERFSLYENRIYDPWLEVRGTPEHIQWLKNEVKRLTAKYSL